MTIDLAIVVAGIVVLLRKISFTNPRYGRGVS